MMNGKIKLLNDKIERQKEFIKMKQKMFKFITIAGVITLFLLITISMFTKRLNALDCFSITLITVTMYTQILEHIKTMPNEKIDLLVLQNELELYTELLKEENKTNEDTD